MNHNIFAAVRLEFVAQEGGRDHKYFGIPVEAEFFVLVQGDATKKSAWDFGIAGVVEEFKCERLDDRRVEIRAVVDDQFDPYSFPANLKIIFNSEEGRIESMILVERASYVFNVYEFEYALTNVKYLDPPELDFEKTVGLEVKGWGCNVPNSINVSCSGNPFHRASWDFGLGMFNMNHFFVEKDDFGIYNINAQLYGYSEEKDVFAEIALIYDSVLDKVVAIRGAVEIYDSDDNKYVVEFKQKEAL